jgi:hypothetical protein
MSNSNRTHERAIAFCAALAETANIGRACAAVGMGRTTAYEWREADAEFAELWDRAMKIGVTALEDEAKRRAFEGVDKPIVHKGQFTYEYERDEKGNLVFDEHTEEIDDKEVVIKTPRLKLDDHGRPKIATVKEYSDTLAIVLLKAHDDKYRDKTSMELTGADGGPVQFSDTERAAKVAALLSAAKQRKEAADNDVSDLI